MAPSDEKLLETVEKAAEKDWRAAVWLIDRRAAEKPVPVKSRLDELAKKRRKRRSA